MKIDLIAGARPNFMKISPIIDAIEAYKNSGNQIDYRLIHTGQHYDDNMSKAFFVDLNIPFPEHNLGAGGGTQSEQTAKIMIEYEKILSKDTTDMCLVVGDVNSTMACAIVAKKKNLNVIHVEGGLRSFDISMPEEINRIVTDSISDIFFTTSENANENLKSEGVSQKRIIFVGNTMIDTLIKNRKNFKKPAIWDDLGLNEKGYIVMTMHRPSNVDNPSTLKKLIETVLTNANDYPLIFSAHPRTINNLKSLKIDKKNFFVISPLGYLEFNYLIERSLAVVTDSGGITEEATYLNIPCITLRKNTERPETVSIGTNVLVGNSSKKIKSAFDKLFKQSWKKGGIPPMWDGKSSLRIVEHLLSL